MDPMRKHALVAGLFYLITFISIPTLVLYDTLKTDPAWILGSGSVTGVLVGTVLELIVALAGIGTAVALYPVVKRQNEGFALGFVASRIIEGAMIFTGCREPAVARDPAAGPGRSGQRGGCSLARSPRARRSPRPTRARSWSGQTLMPVINALLLGTLLYRSGLVPRALPMLGLIGAPILLASVLLRLFGVIDTVSPVSALATLPIAVWEFSLGLYLTFKGFKASAPIMVAAAAEAGRVDAPATAVRPQGTVATTAGAA